MTQDTLLQQGLMLMTAGMGTVFVFLTALVLALNIMSRLVALLPAGEQPVAAGQREDGAEVAAIAAAIHQHRAAKGR